MRFLSLTTSDPAINLAVEEVLTTAPADPTQDIVMLWQNAPTVVIGRNQDARAQVNRAYLEEAGIQLVRRLSGGGAVYHDDGNLNFSIIKRRQAGLKPDFSFFTRPLIEAIGHFGVAAQFSGRNDVEVDGHKISGNAQYRWRDTVMHHGAILFASDLTVLGKALKPKERRSAGFKGVKSHVSRVANLSGYLNCSFADFRQVLTDCLLAGSAAPQTQALTETETQAAIHLADERYRSDDWNWRALGRSGDDEYQEELD